MGAIRPVGRLNPGFALGFFPVGLLVGFATRVIANFVLAVTGFSHLCVCPCAFPAGRQAIRPVNVTIPGLLPRLPAIPVPGVGNQRVGLGIGEQPALSVVGEVLVPVLPAARTGEHLPR